MWVWKKKKKELETTIEKLELSIKILKDRLIDAKVLQRINRPYHDYDNENLKPISLIELRAQINGIKDFLGIEFVTKPAEPAESFMEKRKTTKNERS